MRPVCDRCEKVISDENRCVMPPESHGKPGILEGDEGFLLVNTFKGKHMIVAGMQEPPEGLHSMWVQWRDKFDICRPCMVEVLCEVAQQLQGGMDPRALRERV